MGESGFKQRIFPGNGFQATKMFSYRCIEKARCPNPNLRALSGRPVPPKRCFHQARVVGTRLGPRCVLY